MKTAKRIIALALTALLCFGTVACAAASEPEIVPDFEVADKGEDMGGYVMDFSYALTNSSDDEVVLGYIPNTQLADIAAKRLADVQSKYNCKINIMYSPDFGTGYDLLRASVMSGLHYCDLISNESFSLVNLMRAGYLLGLSGYLDMTNYDKWGTQEMLFSMCWDNDVYAVVPASWPDLIYTSFGNPLCVNTNVVTSLGGTDLREYVENNTWTWDQFEETMHFLTQKTGEKTVYGMSCHPFYFVGMMATTNGDQMIQYNNGEFTCGYFTKTGREALERAQQIYQVTCKECFYPSDDQDIAVEVFVNGESCMVCPTTERILGYSNAILYKVENVGIIPFPMGPNATDYSTQGVYNSLVYATSIPLTCSDVDCTVKILDALYEPFDEYKTQEDLIEYMSQQVFFEPLDTEVFVNMRKTSQYNFFLEKGRNLIESVTTTKKSVTEIVNSYEDFYEELEEEYMIHHYNGQKAVWGN